MPRLPSPDDYALSTPQAARRLVDVPTIRREPDVYTGAAMQDIGVAAGKYADMLKEATDKLDTAKAQEALSKIQQARLDLTMGTQTAKGAYQAKGGDVLTPTYASGYRSQFDLATEGITKELTPAQLAKLKPHMQRESIGFQTDIARHSMAQAEVYTGIVNENRAKTHTSIGIAKRGDETALDTEVRALRDIANEEATRAGLTGKDDKEKDALIGIQQKYVSPVYVGAITGLLDDRKPELARKLLDKGRLDIEPGARLKLEEQVVKAEEGQKTLSVAGDELRRIEYTNTPTSRVASVMRDTLTAVTTRVESGGMGANGGMVDAKGNLIKGPVIQGGASKGQQAVGPHQFMPSTAKEAAKLAGVKWDEELFNGTSAESRKYHDTLHNAHIESLMKQFGTQAEIYAAYNGGAENVRKAQEKFAKTQKLIDMGASPVLPGSYNPAEGPLSFLDFMAKPSETKPYVSKAIALANSLPDMVRPTKAELETSMAAKFPGRPDLAKAAVGVVEHNLSIQEDARKTEIATTKESIFKLMGQGKAFIEISPSMLNKLPVLEQAAVEKEFRAFADGKARDSNQGFLKKIYDDPNFLARVDAAEWEGPARNLLSKYDYDRFSKQRAAIKGGDMSSIETLDTGSVGRALNTRLTFLGIDPTPKERDTTGVDIVVSARTAVEQSILSRQRTLGRKLTDKETTDHIDEMFRNREVVDPLWGGAKNISILATNASDIPSVARDQIEALLKKSGVTKPTDRQILEQYKKIKLGAN